VSTPVSSEPPPNRVRVLIADDQTVVRAGLAMLVDSQPDLTVVGQAGDGREAVRLTAELRPDVVLIVREHAGAGDGAVVRVVVLTTYDLDEYVYDALRAGACGFLLKHAPPEELLLGIRAAADGGAVISPSVTRRLLDEFTARRPTAGREPPELARLTAREREVFDMVVRGLSNTEIARDLVVAGTTVKTHVARALDKLGLRDRVHAIIYAYEHALVEPGHGGRRS
jgi:DNA-binding NarL/FixJ family response regulator